MSQYPRQIPGPALNKFTSRRNPAWRKFLESLGAKPARIKWRESLDVPKFLKKFDAVQKRTAKSKLVLPLLLLALTASAQNDDPAKWRGKPPQESFRFKTNPYPDRAYSPGFYGKVKDAPMFICWREWDGEIRIGGVSKEWSGQCNIEPSYFKIEVQGSGTGNDERLMFGPGATNVIFLTNYSGTIQVGTNFYKLSDLRKP